MAGLQTAFHGSITETVQEGIRQEVFNVHLIVGQRLFLLHPEVGYHWLLTIQIN